MLKQFELLGQTRVKHGARRIAVLSNRRHALVSAGSSRPANLALVDLEADAVVWTRSVPGASAQVLALDADCLVAATDTGRIGEGRSDLEFLSIRGNQLGSAALPDKLTEVRQIGSLMVAGCRDGQLYCFDAAGKVRWHFQVPSHPSDSHDEPGGRPCPFFIETWDDGSSILFSFLDTTYALSNKGELLWKWRSKPTHERRSFVIDGGGEILVVASGTEPIVYGFATSTIAQTCLVATSNGKVTVLDDHGRRIGQLSVEAGPSQIASVSDLTCIVHATWGGISFYSDDERLSHFPSNRLHKLRIAPDDRTVAAWSGKTVRVFGLDGAARAEAEFASYVSDVVFAHATELVVAAGKLTRLSIP